MIRKVLTTFFLLFLAELSIAQSIKTEWVDSVYQTLTLDQRLGQLFIFPAHGFGNQQHINVIKGIIDRYTLGGIKILDGSAESVIRLNQELSNSTTLPLISAINVTGGLGRTLQNTTISPKPLTLGALQSDTIISEVAKITSIELKQLGLNMAIQDGLSLDHQNIFSSNLKIAANKNDVLAQAFTKSNILFANTEFPGTSAKMSKKNLEAGALTPYVNAINKKVSAIVMSNDYSPIDIKNIASLSKNTLDYLRLDLNYQGLIIADDLDELNKYKPGKTEAMAISSGNDLVISTNITNSIKQVKKLIKKGDIPLWKIEKSVKRVLSAKHDLLRSDQPNLSTRNISSRFNSNKSQALINTAYSKSLTAVDPSGLLPIQQLDEKTFASLTLGEASDFQKTLDKYAVFNHYTSDTPIDQLKSVLPLFDYLVVGISNSDLSDELTILLNSLSNDVIICSFGQLFNLINIDKDITKIISIENHPANHKNSAELIFGAISNNGKLPITVHSDLKLGAGISVKKIDRLSSSIPEDVFMDSNILSKINDVIHEAIRDKATPGCQVVIARKGKIIFNNSYGYHTYDSIQPVTENSIYDIASITKVAATTQAIMLLEERKLIDLDKKISLYLNDLKSTNKENMTIRDMLTHQAGLWPYLPFWKETLTDDTFSSVYYSFNEDDDYPYELSEGIYVSNITRDSVWQWVKNSKLRNKGPNATFDYKYSDMGYYILQRLVEQLVNQQIEDFLQQNIYDPMGLNTMSYLPLCKYPQDIIAPTENDNYFRKSLVNGWVHDQGAAMMGGVAGHAGLFSNALDLAKLMQMHLQKGTYGGHKYYLPETLEKFTSVQYKSNRRGIGWDKPVVGEWNSPTSAYASKKSFGHTGFTGTAVWADPEFDLVYVFLSNRIYPDADNKKLIQNNIRTRIQDFIYQSIWSFAATHTDSCN